MTESEPAGFLQQAGAVHTAALMRTYMGGLLAGSFASGTSARTRGGVHNTLGGQLVVSANGTPNMSVNVAAGLAYIPGTESTLQGMYFCHNGATVNLSIATAPGTGLNRIDLVVAQVLDSFYSGSIDKWQLAVVTGTAASSPTAPTAPNNSLVLAQVLVGANVTSITSGNITDMRQFATGLGGVTKCTSTTHPQNMGVGDIIWESDTNRFNYWNGSTWYWPLPRGVVGGQKYTGTGNFVTGLTTPEVAIGMSSGAIALEANRQFRIAVSTKYNVSAVGTAIFAHIRDGSLAGTQIAQTTLTPTLASTDYQTYWEGRYETTSAVTKTFVITADGHAAGSCGFKAGGTTSPVYVIVEDMGPTGNVTTLTTP